MTRINEKPNSQPKGLFAKFKEGLREAQRFLNTDVRDLFKNEGRLVDDNFLAELRAILIRTGMGPAAAATIVDEIERQFRARVVRVGNILAVIKSAVQQH
jgi:fused signal recognition particle receptor